MAAMLAVGLRQLKMGIYELKEHCGLLSARHKALILAAKATARAISRAGHLPAQQGTRRQINGQKVSGQVHAWLISSGEEACYLTATLR